MWHKKSADKQDNQRDFFFVLVAFLSTQQKKKQEPNHNSVKNYARCNRIHWIEFHFISYSNYYTSHVWVMRKELEHFFLFEMILFSLSIQLIISIDLNGTFWIDL